MENNIPSATHQEKAKKMKKLRRWQIAVSLLGVAIIVWGATMPRSSNMYRLSTCVLRDILIRFTLPSIRRYIKGIL